MTCHLPKNLYTVTTHPGKHNIVLIQPMFEDAFSVYINKGTCIGQANLASAFFRAAGIPARILICESRGLATYHCYPQYYVPGYGWIITNPLFAENLCMPENCLILKVCSPEDKNNAGHGLQKYGGIQPTNWINNNNVVGSIARGRMYGDENNILVNLELGDGVFNLTQNIWILFTKHAGKDLGSENNQYFLNATLAQQDALKCFKESNFEGYFENMTHAYNEYVKIESS